MTEQEELIEQYGLKDFSLNHSTKPGKEIIHITCNNLPTRELKLLLERILNDIYNDRYIREAFVLLQPKGEEVFVDISVQVSEKQGSRIKQFHLQDIWVSRSIKKEGGYTHMTYSTPYFYNSSKSKKGNQLLLSVTVNSENSSDYVITSAIEAWDKESGTKEIQCVIPQYLRTDKQFPRMGVVDFFNKTTNLLDIYNRSLNCIYFEETITCPTDSNIWQAHLSYIDY